MNESVIVSALDLGTNSVKCLVAQVDSAGRLEVITELRRITRLGENLGATGRLLPAAIARTCDAVCEMVQSARASGAEHIRIAATAAMRDAENAHELIDCVQGAVGVTIDVISGEEEARLSFLGVRSIPGFECGPLCLVDIGGGSCEWAMGDDSGITFRRSLPLGAVRVTEARLTGDPPCVESIEQARNDIREMLMEIPDPAGRVAGVGGTFSTMAAVAQCRVGVPVRIEGFRLTADEADTQIALYAARTVSERREIAGLEPGRADIILAGALIARLCMARAGVDSLVVTGRGLRYGLALKIAREALRE